MSAASNTLICFMGKWDWGVMIYEFNPRPLGILGFGRGASGWGWRKTIENRW